MWFRENWRAWVRSPSKVTPAFLPDKVRSLTKLKPGDKVKQEHVTRALERLREKYQKNDHLEAQVSLIDHHYHPDTNRLDYVFKAEEGPTVAITAEGAKISNRELKKLVPVYQENSVDDDLLNEGRRNLRDYLQTKGYFDADGGSGAAARHRRRTTSTSFTRSIPACATSWPRCGWKATSISITTPSASGWRSSRRA